ncbi:MAG: hypothetical protein KBA64_05275, partial [Armatimonadetes bacterium]|nr:hypothetical protein [Armatimonadota bacterium]
MVGRALLVVVLLLAGVAAAAQEGQTMAETLVSQAEANLNNAVMMKGLAGRYEPGPNNTIVYTLTDRNNGTIRVRGFGELDLATTYIVFGTITRNATTSKLE